MEKRIPVHMEGKWIYDIVMEESFLHLEEELKKLEVSGRKICIVTDSNVASLYLDEVLEIASGCCREIYSFVFPAGEEHKNLDTVQRLYKELIEKKFDRHDFLIALGGGVTGDLCGYGAATYLRGISFIQIPTTLLSQVDSSIGGKTGVDFDSYKNMVGSFHMPRLVYSNTAALKTLPGQQFSSGMGEIIKHGLIKDAGYYDWLKEHVDEVKALRLSVLSEMVYKSNEIKRSIVEKDPKEQGERALLNFGHTLGHAIEKLKEFELLHGHCVGLGCISAMELSAARGYLEKEDTRKLRSLLKAFDMPLGVQGLSKEAIIAATKNDKKMDCGAIRFILLEDIGKAVVDHTVTDKEMAAALDAILE